MASPLASAPSRALADLLQRSHAAALRPALTVAGTAAGSNSPSPAGAAASVCRQQQPLRRRRSAALQRARSSAVPAPASAADVAEAAEVKAVLFDMDGVLTDSEYVSRLAATETMKELYGLTVQPDDFLPFTGTGENNFLGGVARKYGAQGFDIEACKAKFFEVYMNKYCLPGAGIGHEGARALVETVRAAGLATAVASSADRVKIDASLAAAEIPQTLFGTIVSADAFERLKPAPDIFLAAAAQLGVPPANCVVIEDAVAGVQAARAAGMRVIGVTTSLSLDKMEAAAPDLILPNVRSVTLEAIVGLRPAQQQQQQQQQAQQAQQQQERPQGGAAAPAAGAQAASSSSSSGPATSSAGPSSSGSGGGGGSAAWLNEWVDLPAGYKTTRRDLLKFASLGAAFASLYVGLTRAQRDPGVRRWLLRYHVPTLIQLAIIAYVTTGWSYLSKSLSYASPQAILNALLPQGRLPDAAADGEGGRVAAFKRYIGDLEKRGGGQAVPDFPAGAEWFNAPPLRLERELRGKVVLLDLWTYCCVNCMHVLPDLAFLERKFEASPLAVVGVHSAKFDNERDGEAVKAAVLRYNVEHPVVNDSGMTLWRALGVSSWPTLAVVSPQGRLITMLAGEGHRQDLDDIITAALEYYGEAGLLDNTPLPVALEREKDPRLAASPLRFPGKLATDLAGGHLFISDSSNNRLVITDLRGAFVAQIGCGAPGLLDGSWEEAAFNRPQGVAYSAKRDCLYVADTESHALREVDLRKKSVRTLAGNGTKGAEYAGGAGGAAQALNSPWDVALDSTEQYVFIAMAGQHQVWRFDTATGTAASFSGSGYERNQNGATGLTTAWAQPSGLALTPSGDALLVADSESSAIRKLDLRTGGGQAVVGGDPLFSDNLFRFGDKDGSGADALLQHPLAVLTAPDGTVYVADSYNHRLKQLDPGSSTIATLAGSGAAGYQDGAGTAAQLSEPGGLALGPDGAVLIADTNNSLIRSYEPRTRKLSTLALTGVPPPRRSPNGPPVGAAGAALEPPPGAALVLSGGAPVAAAAGEVRLTLNLPAGYHLTPGANSRFEASALGGAADGTTLQPAAGSLAEAGGTATGAVAFRRASGSGAGLLRVLAKVYFCPEVTEASSTCLFQEVCFDVQLAEAAAAPASSVALAYSLSASAPNVTLPGL